MRSQAQLTRIPTLYAAASIPRAAHIGRRSILNLTAANTKSSAITRPVHSSCRSLHHQRSSNLFHHAIRAMATTSESAMSASEQASLIESSKRAAAYQAVKEHMGFSYRHIGIGSGSTVIYVVEALASLGRDNTDKMSFYSTGDQSRELILGAGFRLQYIQDMSDSQQLDVVFDGADEVDEELNLIKGGGACLFQEKLVAIKAKKFVCVAGEFPPGLLGAS